MLLGQEKKDSEFIHIANQVMISREKDLLEALKTTMQKPPLGPF
jgi:hypothetical protein